MNTAVILAAGTGARVHADIPKQFIKIMDKPILAYALEQIERTPEVHAIEIVCSEEWAKEVRKICADYNIAKLRWIAFGGDTFQQSAWNGIFNLKGKLASDDIVTLSFGVSPFCTPDIIGDSIRVAKERGNGISAEDSYLCTCIKDDEFSTTRNLIRETIKGFSNPWSFRFGEVLEAYEEARRKGILDELEPHTTSVYLALGKRLWFSKSGGHNFKITTKEDLERFEGLLLLKRKREEEAGRGGT